MQTEGTILKLNVDLLVPNKYQPRKEFDEKELETLSESIKLYGILNPILARENNGKYEIIAGERRYRAAKLAGLKEVPIIIKSVTEQEMAEMALIENVQRSDLSPIEEAKSYDEIIKISKQTQGDLAKKIGKSQSFIANKIRLLSLPKEIQVALMERKISERHARCLLTVEDQETQIDLLNKIIKDKLTVKETEQMINQKEITEEEIKQAISDIMKSLNIDSIDDEEKEEKEEDNMNNGNFFPNYENNMNNNNTSLNMMNMQSMETSYTEPQTDMVMPTNPNIISSPMNIGQQFNEPMPNPMDIQQPVNIMPADSGYQNSNTFFNQQPTMNMNFNPEPTIIEPVQPMLSPETNPVMQDTPLFNPAAFEVPTSLEPTVIEPQIITPEPVILSPVVEEKDKLTKLQELLTEQGYTYKVYNNDTTNCVIIEFPKN